MQRAINITKTHDEKGQATNGAQLSIPIRVLNLLCRWQRAWKRAVRQLSMATWLLMPLCAEPGEPVGLDV